MVARRAKGEGGVYEETAATLAEMAALVNYHVGTPDVVASDLNDYLAMTRCDSLNVMVHGPGLSHGVITTMLRLVAEEVVPRLWVA